MKLTLNEIQLIIKLARMEKPTPLGSIYAYSEKEIIEIINSKKYEKNKIPLSYPSND